MHQQVQMWVTTFVPFIDDTIPKFATSLTEPLEIQSHLFPDDGTTHRELSFYWHAVEIVTVSSCDEPAFAQYAKLPLG